MKKRIGVLAALGVVLLAVFLLWPRPAKQEPEDPRIVREEAYVGGLVEYRHDGHTTIVSPDIFHISSFFNSLLLEETQAPPSDDWIIRVTLSDNMIWYDYEEPTLERCIPPEANTSQILLAKDWMRVGDTTYKVSEVVVDLLIDKWFS